MTDQERKMLKSYLTECLEPRLKIATAKVESYEQKRVDAGDSYTADLSENMRRHFMAQSIAYQHAIEDFRELFEEDLKEGE